LEGKGELDVLKRCELGNQVESLEDKSQLVETDRGELIVGCRIAYSWEEAHGERDEANRLAPIRLQMIVVDYPV
jgi:hypothetical protein